MIDFFKTAGIKAFGSRLRMLIDSITTDAAGIYELYGIEMQPEWFPVFYALSSADKKPLQELTAKLVIRILQ